MRDDDLPELRVLTGSVIAAAMEVHRELGPGYGESVYEEAMAIELERQSLRFSRQHPFEVRYRGSVVGEGRVDFLVDERLVVELKAVEAFAPIHRTQVLAYLKSLGLQLGLLINFKVPALRAGIQRIILT